MIEVAFTDVSLSLGDAAEAEVRHEAAAPGRGRDRRPRRSLMHQVHGADVVLVDDGGAGEAPRRATPSSPRSPAWRCSPRAADCVPVLLADPATGWIAAVHCGRPGLAAGVVPARRRRPARARAPSRPSPGSARTCAAPATRCPPTCRTRWRRWCPRRARPPRGARPPSTSAPAYAPSSTPPASPTSASSTPARARTRRWPSYRRDGAAATRFAGVIWSHP